ncbi:tyrosine-type recombinase/integrase [Anaerosporobacter faecicola]|uniref:tyrosine-type recombinase/integrase n=1 Tax=Anaerosporobacter faecicola TaxID=2718714 RepID=UPI00143C696F|nr:tyrosine-type recombinase/integrase [Anaerosporobacter faecicola]
MKEKTYQEQLNIENTKKLRELIKDMPPYVATYFRGIENRTAPRTRIAYAIDIHTFFEFIQVNNPNYRDKPIREFGIELLTQLESTDIEEYLDYIKLYTKDGVEYSNNERGIKRKLAALRSFYGYFHKNKMINENPVLQVDMPKLHEKAIIRLDVDEVATLLDTVESGNRLTEKQQAFHTKTKERDLAIMTLLLGTGIRVSECVGLNLQDVDFNNSRIKITRKGGYEAFVYFGEEVTEALQVYLSQRKELVTATGHEDALFLSLQKKRMGVRSIELLVKKYASTVTTMKKITPHKLRSTYGTSLYRETGDIYLVADVLGHKDVNTTRKHYAALEEERRRSAKDAVRLRE